MSKLEQDFKIFKASLTKEQREYLRNEYSRVVLWDKLVTPKEYLERILADSEGTIRRVNKSIKENKEHEERLANQSN